MTKLGGSLAMGLVLGLASGNARAEAVATDTPQDERPRVTVTLSSTGAPMDVGVERDRGDARGAQFEVVCKTPCAVSVPTKSASQARLQVRASNSPGAAFNVDPIALDGQRLTLVPPTKQRIRAGAALLAVGIITTAVGGVFMPFGRDLASRADINPDAGFPGGVVTFGAGVATTIAGAMLLATARPKVHRVDRSEVGAQAMAWRTLF